MVSLDFSPQQGSSQDQQQHYYPYEVSPTADRFRVRLRTGLRSRRRGSFSDEEQDLSLGSIDQRKSKEARKTESHKTPVSVSVSGSDSDSEDAAEGEFMAIKEGLDFALGTSGKDGRWMPKSDQEESDDDHHHHHHVHTSPKLRLDTSAKTLDAGKRNSLLAMDPYGNNASILSHTPVTPTFGSGLNLELGIGPEIAPVASPAAATINKFSDALARVSERIAGTGAIEGDADSKKDALGTHMSPKKDSKPPGSPKRSLRMSPAASVSSASPAPSIHGGLSSNWDSAPPGGGYGDNLEVLTSRETSGQVHLPFISIEEQQHSLSQKSSRDEFVDEVALEESEPSQISVNRIFGTSLRIFSTKSKVRVWCYRLASHSLFPPILLCLLILQVTFLSVQQWNPGEDGGYVVKGNAWTDYVLIGINVAYTFEIAIQIIAYGLVDDRCMYEELGIEYPENELNIFSKTNMNSLMRYLEPFRNRYSVKRIIARRYKSVSPDPKTDNECTEEIELNEYPTKRDTSIDYSNSDELTDVGAPVLPSQKLKMKNTFIVPTVQKSIGELGLSRAYLRSSWHRIDFLSMCFFWVSLLFSINRYDARNQVMIFRSLSCLRIIRIVNLTKGTTTILLALKTAIPQLLDVVLFIAMFWVFFGIVGVQSFKSSLTRHCVWTNPNDPTETFVNTNQYCGSALRVDGTTESYIFRDGDGSGVVKGFRCPINSRCISGANPYGGTVNFDNIFQSMEMVFVVMSANTFTDIMYDITDSDDLVAALFFMFCIFVMTVWLMNIFIAVIVSCFRTASQESRRNKNRAKKRALLNFTFDLKMDKNRLEALRKKNKMFAFYQDKRIDLVFVFLILTDLIVQCTRLADMSQNWHSVLYRTESAFTAIFVGEIILRFCLYFPDFRLFFYSKRNIFDLFLAVVTGIIIIGPIKEAMGHTYYWLTVFQVMRFYRVVMSVGMTNTLWSKIVTQIDEIIQLALFYFLLLFSVGILVARYFEGSILPDEIDEVSFPMQTLPGVLVALYTVTSTENWTETMYFMQEVATNVQYRVFGLLFIVSWFIFSYFIIIQIFIAIIATTLEVSDEVKRRKQLLQFINNMTSRLQDADNETSLLRKVKKKFFKTFSSTEDSKKSVVNLLLSGTAIKDFVDKRDLDISDSEDEGMSRMEIIGWKGKFLNRFRRNKKEKVNPFNSKVEYKPKINLDLFDPALFARDVIKDRNAVIAKQNAYLIENPTYNRVFWIIGPRHKIRRFCQRIVKSCYGARIDGVEPYGIVNEVFQISMFLASIALVVSACVATPAYKKELNEKHGLYNWSLILMAGFVSIFSLEFIIKVVADGFSLTPNAYMRESWNKIDLIVLISIWIEFIASVNGDGGVSRAVAGLKALRTLRLLGISKTATQTFNMTLIKGFRQILGAAMIAWCLLFPFSIWCLNVLNGRLGVCLNGDLSRAECINEFSNTVFNWDVVSPNAYTEPYLEFNKFASSISTLYEIISLEGWVDLLVNVMASTGVGTPAQPNSSPINGLLIILFNFISVVFILTLFVSVIVNNYSKISGKAYLTPEQIGWYHVRNILGQVRPSHRKNLTNMKWYSRICYKITVEKSSKWKDFLGCVLALHVLALILEAYPTWFGLEMFRICAFLIASVIFTVNSIISILGYGFKEFFRRKWNVFSTFISIGALITTIIGRFLLGQSVFVNINKLFLVGMLSFIIPRSDKLSQLFRFASSGLPSLLALLYTWGIMFLLFAIALNQIFGLTKIGPNGTGNLNVRSVPKAFILLFRCSFGEGWNYIMDDYTISWPLCTPGLSVVDGDCGNEAYAYILFIAWNILSMYIFLNLFISVILDSFSFIGNSNAYGHLIEREEIRKFKKSWQEFDPEGTGFISPEDLPKFLQSLDGALSFHFYSGELSIPVLCKKWITRNNPHDPYDVTLDFDALEEVLSQVDIPKVRERRHLFEQFVEEAITAMVLNNEVGISFRRIIIQIPLYSAFTDGECLNLIDYLERRLLMQRVQKRLKRRRVLEIMSGYACRWKYLQNKHRGIWDRDIDLGSDMRKRISLFEPRSSIELEEEDEDEDYDDNDDDNKNNNKNNEKYRRPAKKRNSGTLAVGGGVPPAILVSNFETSPSQPKEDSDLLIDREVGDYVPRAPLNLFKGNDTPALLTEMMTNRQQLWQRQVWGNVFADDVSDSNDADNSDADEPEVGRRKK